VNNHPDKVSRVDFGSHIAIRVAQLVGHMLVANLAQADRRLEDH
jgi:hypothetical protein